MRSVRYLLRIVVILAAVFAVMAATHMLEGGVDGMLDKMFHSPGGAILLCVLVALAAAYPYFAFTTLSIGGDITADRSAVAEVFRSIGYSPAGSDGGRMVFRADSAAKRLGAQWSDAITVWGEGGRIYMEGLRKNVARAELRLSSMPDQVEEKDHEEK